MTITDALLAMPIAYYMARVASPRKRGLLVVAVLVPLWAAYLVKVYSWRIILQGNGLVDWALAPFGMTGPGLSEIGNSWLVLSYLWLPYMILPVYAGFERIPNSLLEASSDLGARSLTTFRRVVTAARLPGAGRRLDLHVLADAGRLHHARPGVRREDDRQRHLRQRGQRQPAARGGLLADADRDHDRATCSSRGAWAPSSRCEPEMTETRCVKVLLRLATVGVLGVPVPADRRAGHLRLQLEPHPGVAAVELHAPVVRRGEQQPADHSRADRTRSSRRRWPRPSR